MQVVAYARVSTDKQAERGMSPEAQEEKLRVHAALYEPELVGLEVGAGVSAKTLKRPARLRALYAEGHTLQEIANQLNAEGVLTISGKGTWQKGTIGNLLAQGSQVE
jgi:Resolvase, N terminal domain/Recombinase